MIFIRIITMRDLIIPDLTGVSRKQLNDRIDMLRLQGQGASFHSAEVFILIFCSVGREPELLFRLPVGYRTGPIATTTRHDDHLVQCRSTGDRLMYCTVAYCIILTTALLSIGSDKKCFQCHVYDYLEEVHCCL